MTKEAARDKGRELLEAIGRELARIAEVTQDGRRFLRLETRQRVSLKTLARDLKEIATSRAGGWSEQAQAGVLELSQCLGKLADVSAVTSDSDIHEFHMDDETDEKLHESLLPYRKAKRLHSVAVDAPRSSSHRHVNADTIASATTVLNDDLRPALARWMTERLCDLHGAAWWKDNVVRYLRSAKKLRATIHEEPADMGQLDLRLVLLVCQYNLMNDERFMPGSDERYGMLGRVMLVTEARNAFSHLRDPAITEESLLTYCLAAKQLMELLGAPAEQAQGADKLVLQLRSRLS